MDFPFQPAADAGFQHTADGFDLILQIFGQILQPAQAEWTR